MPADAASPVGPAELPLAPAPRGGGTSSTIGRFMSCPLRLRIRGGTRIGSPAPDGNHTPIGMIGQTAPRDPGEGTSPGLASCSDVAGVVPLEAGAPKRRGAVM